MAVEEWIDEVAKTWATIRAGGKGHVKAFKQADFPEAITDFPSVITFVTGVRLAMSGDSSPHVLIWSGQSEFYLAAGTTKSAMPQVNLYFDRILRAALKRRQLGGAVSEFRLVGGAAGETVNGPAVLNYGGEQSHLGLVVHWEVKEVMNSVELGR